MAIVVSLINMKGGVGKTTLAMQLALAVVGSRRHELLTQLGRMFESKQFLPNLREADEFFRRSGAPDRRYKSRKEVLGPVLKQLSQMPESELPSLVTHSTDALGKSDYAVLANQLMGKKQ